MPACAPCVAPMVADLTFYEAIPGLLDALPPPLRAKRSPALTAAARRATLAAMRAVAARLAARPRPGPPRRSRRPSRSIARMRSSPAGAAGARLSTSVLHSHVAESKVQAVAGLQRYGKTLTAHLDELGLLGPHFTVAHGVWLDDDDMRRLGRPRRLGRAQSGQQHAARLRHRRCPAMLERGVNLGIGTDRRICSDNQNMYEAMRLASLVSKVQGPDWHRWLRPARCLARRPRAAPARWAWRPDRPHRAGLQGRHRLARSRPRELDAGQRSGQPARPSPRTAPRRCGDDRRPHGGRERLQGRLRHDQARPRLRSRARPARDLERDARALSARLEGVVGSFCVGLSNAPYHIHRYGHAH